MGPDGTVLLGVEKSPVAVHPFGTEGLYLVDKADRVHRFLPAIHTVRGPVSISASRCCSVVKIPRVALADQRYNRLLPPKSMMRPLSARRELRRDILSTNSGENPSWDAPCLFTCQHLGLIGVFNDVRRRIALWRTSAAARPKKCSTTT
jgi:hypothetical protein